MVFETEKQPQARSNSIDAARNHPDRIQIAFDDHPPDGQCWADPASHPGLAPRPTAWVQGLLAAKRDLDLPRRLRKLDNFDFLLLDDLGYLPQGAEESEVLFTLIAERYERRSLGITLNLVFSEWERIFANPMATPRRLTGSCTTPSSWSLTSPATGPTWLRNGAKPRR